MTMATTTVAVKTLMAESGSRTDGHLSFFNGQLCACALEFIVSLPNVLLSKGVERKETQAPTVALTCRQASQTTCYYCFSPSAGIFVHQEQEPSAVLVETRLRR